MGEIADGVNALISLGRGDVTGAALSATSMLPIVGDAIGKGGKIARAAIKHGDEVLEAAGKQVDEVLETLPLRRLDVEASSMQKVGDTSNPVFRVSRKKHPNHARMLENAQKEGHSLKNLTRGSGTRAAQKNRYESQKVMRKLRGGPPKGYDYDEFPYASTKQGGGGAHVELVPSVENQSVGRDLGQFYKQNNLHEDDLFDVEIIDLEGGIDE